MRMDLANIKIIKSLLKKCGIRPNKVLGQHFLVSRHALDAIITAADLSKKDTVLEVGPGLGVLTKALAQRAGNVIAVEKDPALIPILREILSDYTNLQIIHDDVLRLPVTRYPLLVTRYKIVADIPYYLTSRFLRIFLETPHQPTHMVLLVQKEVAMRICAKPPSASLLSNAVQYYAKTEVIEKVKKNSFFPEPKIDSAILRLDLIRNYDEKVDKNMFLVLKVAFSGKRKQIFGSFSKKYGHENVERWLKIGKIEKNQRPQEVSLKQWIELAKQVL